MRRARSAEWFGSAVGERGAGAGFDRHRRPARTPERVAACPPAGCRAVPDVAAAPASAAVA